MDSIQYSQPNSAQSTLDIFRYVYTCRNCSSCGTCSACVMPRVFFGSAAGLRPICPASCLICGICLLSLQLFAWLALARKWHWCWYDVRSRLTATTLRLQGQYTSDGSNLYFLFRSEMTSHTRAASPAMVQLFNFCGSGILLLPSLVPPEDSQKARG
jgi:hypothetical protein